LGHSRGISNDNDRNLFSPIHPGAEKRLPSWSLAKAPVIKWLAGLDGGILVAGLETGTLVIPDDICGKIGARLFSPK